jgi:hypothetical protein
VYKVSRRVGTAGAADIGGPFGSGRLRSGQRVVWFYCRPPAGGGCQHTLELSVRSHHAAPGAAVAVTVRAYDDFGRGRAVAGAQVALGLARARTGPAGGAVLAAPASAGRARLTATATGLVPAFPVTMVIG